MKQIIVTGKTYEEALQDGLMQLRAIITDVDVVTLEEGSKGLFGLFGSRPYKLQLTLREEEEVDPTAALFPVEKKPAPEKKEKPARKEPKPEKKPEAPKAEEKPAAPVTEAPKAEDNATEQTEKKPEAPKPVQRKAKQPREKKAEDGEKTETEQKPAQEKKPRQRKERAPKTEGEKPAKKEQPKREPKPKAEVRPLEKPVVTMIPDEQVEADSAAGKAQSFLKELTHLMGVDVEVAVGTDEEKNVFVQMTGDTLGILIGRRGETLDALQYLTSLKVNRGQDDYTRVTLDTENYRAKREDTLIRLANRMANRAVKTGRKVSLEAMNPYERRIIHSALQANDAVDTHSEGEEPNRHVVITLRK
ncbi:MAG: KH domain-containing protein [Clostridia bacterium]|nr:KH domain-containing protein [Clostridia bacterium]